jgi:hypothetical protein
MYGAPVAARDSLTREGSVSCTVTATSVILLSIRKKLCSLNFIITMTDIQNFCDRYSVTHNKNQNAT